MTKSRQQVGALRDPLEGVQGLAEVTWTEHDRDVKVTELLKVMPSKHTLLPLNGGL